MSPTLFSLRHRTTILVLTFLIVIVGLVSYLSMPLESAPDIKMPYVLIMVPYRGASPDDVEQLVTNRLENEFQDLNDVEEMRSTSSEGASMVVLKFLPDTEITDAMQRVRDRVNRARPELPLEIEEPDIREISSSDWPILMVNISGDVPLVRLKSIADDLGDEIEKIDGVLETNVTGGQEREIRVEIDPLRLTAVGISLQEIVTALAAENINLPGGYIDQGKLRYTLRIDRELKDPLELANYVVGVKNGHPVKVSELGRIVDDFKEPTTISRYMGKPGVSISVKKKPGANIVKVVDTIKKTVEKASSAFPAGTRVNFLNDRGKEIKDMVGELENNIITALLLVVAVLFMFIGGRNAVFVAVAIPLSMLISFVILDAMGVTLNFVTLFSLILALGMLVDNAIVVIENTYRHFQDGKSAFNAALDATREVAWPVTTSTLTTVAVFIPLLSWPGIMGKFMSYLPLTLIVTLMSSLFVALTINPVIASAFMTKKADKNSLGARLRGRLRHGYENLMGWCMDHRLIFFSLTILMFFLSAGAVVAKRPPVEFMPTTTPERTSVIVETQEGTNIFHTDKVASAVERKLLETPNIKDFVMDVGSSGGRLFGSSAAPNYAQASIDFPEERDRVESPLVTIERIRAFLAEIPGAKFEIQKEKMGPPSGAAVNIELAGTDFAQLAEISRQVQQRIKGIKGLTDLRDDYSENRPELALDVDRVLSRQLVENPLQAVAATVRTAIYGTKATVYRVGDKEYDVTVRLADQHRQRQEDVLALTVAGKEGKQIPLSQIAAIRDAKGTASIRHLAAERVVTVTAEAEGRPGAEVLREVREKLKDFHPRDVSISFTGENKEMQKSQIFMSKALLVGVFLIALILLTEFNSFAQSGIILFTVLLSMIGVFWGIVITGMNFSVLMTGLGIISLAGVVVNNGIILIDFMNQIRARGVPLREAVIQAGIMRTRPVLLTAGCTVLGLVPMAQGIDLNFRTLTVETGTGSMEFWGPMAIAVIYGMTFATVLTLVAVPTMYYTAERAKSRMAAYFTRRPRVRSAIIALALLLMGLISVKIVSGISALMNG